MAPGVTGGCPPGDVLVVVLPFSRENCNIKINEKSADDTSSNSASGLTWRSSASECASETIASRSAALSRLLLLLLGTEDPRAARDWERAPPSNSLSAAAARRLR